MQGFVSTDFIQLFLTLSVHPSIHPADEACHVPRLLEVKMFVPFLIFFSLNIVLACPSKDDCSILVSSKIKLMFPGMQPDVCTNFFQKHKKLSSRLWCWLFEEWSKREWRPLLLHLMINSRLLMAKYKHCYRILMCFELYSVVFITIVHVLCIHTWFI